MNVATSARCAALLLERIQGRGQPVGSALQCTHPTAQSARERMGNRNNNNAINNGNFNFSRVRGSRPAVRTEAGPRGLHSKMAVTKRRGRCCGGSRRHRSQGSHGSHGSRRTAAAAAERFPTIRSALPGGLAAWRGAWQYRPTSVLDQHNYRPGPCSALQCVHSHSLVQCGHWAGRAGLPAIAQPVSIGMPSGQCTLRARCITHAKRFWRHRVALGGYTGTPPRPECQPPYHRI